MSVSKYLSVRWQILTEGSINRQIFGAAVTIGFLTLVVRFFTFIKEIVVAGSFGISAELDVFLLALTIIGLPVGIVLNALQSSFIPVFVKISSSGDTSRAQSLLATTAILSLFATAGITVLMLGGLPFLLKVLALGFSPAKRQLTESFIWELLPYLFLSGLNLLSHGVLQAEKRFWLSSFTPVFTPVATIVIILSLGNKIGVKGLIFATIAGAVIEFLFLQVALKRKGYRLFSFKTTFTITQEVKKIYCQTIALMGGAFLMYGTTLVDQAMASTLDAGSISALSYGSKIPALISSIGATALATAVFPYFSELVAKGDLTGCFHTIKRYIQLILIIVLPFVAILMIFSAPIVRLIFERGTFTADASQLVSGIQQGYLFQVPSYILSILAVRFISAMGNNHILTLISLSNFILNISLNWLFMHYWGVKGIAYSTAVVYFFSTVFCYIYVYTSFRPSQR